MAARSLRVAAACRSREQVEWTLGTRNSADKSGQHPNVARRMKHGALPVIDSEADPDRHRHFDRNAVQQRRRELPLPYRGCGGPFEKIPVCCPSVAKDRVVPSLASAPLTRRTPLYRHRPVRVYRFFTSTIFFLLAQLPHACRRNACSGKKRSRFHSPRTLS